MNVINTLEIYQKPQQISLDLKNYWIGDANILENFGENRL